MPEVHCERQIDKGLRLIAESGKSRCDECIPDFLARGEYISNRQCPGYAYYLAVKPIRVFKIED